MSPRRRFDPRAFAALVAQRFTLGTRPSRRYLVRMAIATLLVLITWAQLSALDGQDGSRYRSEAEDLALVLIGVTIAYAVIDSLAAGGELAGKVRARALDLLALSGLGPATIVTASFVARSGLVLLRCLPVLPCLASLSLVGGVEVEALPRAVLCLALVVPCLVGLALAVSPGASSSGTGIARSFGSASALFAILLAIAEPFPVVAEELFSLTPFALLEQTRPAGRAILGSAVFALLGVAIAAARLDRRFATRPRRAATTAATATARPSTTAPLTEARPLDWLGRAAQARVGRKVTSLWLGVAAVAALHEIAVSGAREAWRKMTTSPGLEIIICAAGLLALVLTVAGVRSFWARLDAGGLLPILLASPLPGGTYLAAALRAGLRLAAPALLLFYGLLVGAGLDAELSAGRWLAAHLMIAGSVLLVVAIGALGTVGVASGRARLRLDLTALLFLGAPVSVILLEVADHAGGDIVGALLTVVLWAILLNAAVVAPLVLQLTGGLGDPRRLRLIPALVLALSLPAAAVLASSHEEYGFFLYPYLTLPAATIEACASTSLFFDDSKDVVVHGLLSAVPLVIAGVIAAWTRHRFDDLTPEGRVKAIARLAGGVRTQPVVLPPLAATLRRPAVIGMRCAMVALAIWGMGLFEDIDLVQYAAPLAWHLVIAALAATLLLAGPGAGAMRATR